MDFKVKKLAWPWTPYLIIFPTSNNCTTNEQPFYNKNFEFNSNILRFFMSLIHSKVF